MDVDGHVQLNEVVEKAKNKEYNVAVSNRCFETWLVMHQDAWSAKTCESCAPTKSEECKRCYNDLHNGQYRKSLALLEHAVFNAKSVETEETLISEIPPMPGSRVYKFIEALGIFEIE